ncbi:general secretion pathway protein GspB [Desulfomarina sp.]
MSYILNALKKSAQKRQHDEKHSYDFIRDPLPITLPFDFSEYRKPVFVSCLILVFSLFLGTWFFKSSPPPSKQGKKGEQHHQETARLTPRVSTVKLSELTITPLPWQGKTLSEPRKKPRQKIPQINSQPLPDQPELPATAKDKFPQLHFAGHAYSTIPSKRMIIINNAILREGERINTQLRLVEITRRGIILERDGEKFRIELE